MSQDELEGEIGGSFIDDILGEMEYPPEEELIWSIKRDAVYLKFNNKTWYRSTFFDEEAGEYQNEWKSYDIL